MIPPRLKVTAAFLTIIFVLSGCIVNIKTARGYDGGVFITEDFGDNWRQITSVYRVSEQAKNFSSEDLTAMVIDPTDPKAIYIGTSNNGMFYTYDGGIGWQRTLSGLGDINAIAISPKERCIIYAAIDNKVYKSTDCNRHWSYQFIETREDPKNTITTLAIDSFNPNTVYAGTSGNGLFISNDAGFSWRALRFFDGKIIKILINPNNSRIIYVASLNSGIFKTVDNGKIWKQVLSDSKLSGKSNALVYRELILDPTAEDGILYASQHGLLRSRNGGETFEDIKLLTPPSTTAIYSIAINPRNGEEIYYGIANAFYRTVDGGQNWITRKLPSDRAARFLYVDPLNGQNIYLGVKKIK